MIFSRFRLRTTVPVLLPALLTALVGAGIFGCQGCQSSGNTDPGSPDEIIEKIENPGASEPGNSSHEEPSPPPREEPREGKLAEWTDDIEYKNAEIRYIFNGVITRDDTEATALKKLVQLFRAARDKHPDDIVYEYLYANALLQIEQYAEARKIFESCLAKDKDFLFSWKGIALSWVKEDEKKALELLKNLTESSVPGPWGLMLVAEFFADLGETEKAEEALAKAQAKHPGSVRPAMKLAQFYGGMKVWEKAFHWMEKALKRAPRNQKAWFLSASLHIGRIRTLDRSTPDVKGMYEAQLALAKGALEKCLKIDPESPLGREADKSLKELDNPRQKYIDRVDDATAPVKERLVAIAMLIKDASKDPLEIWVRWTGDAQWKIRMAAIKGLGYRADAESCAALGGIIAEKERKYTERNEAASVLRVARRISPKDVIAELDRVFLGLVGGLEVCRDEIGKNSDEALVFQEILDTLKDWTGKHFGEGGSHVSAEGMQKTIDSWKGWWAEK